VIQAQIKLRLKPRHERRLSEWLHILTGVWNWAIRKIEQDAEDGIYYSRREFQNLLANHSEKLGLPSHTLQGVLANAHMAWGRCFKKIARKPRLKGHRNRLAYIPFPDPIRRPEGNYIRLPGLGRVRFHKQDLPAGTIKGGLVRRSASGWYLCLFIDTAPKAIPHVSAGMVGIDPGFSTLLTLSTGEKIAHPREWRAAKRRLAKAQRGGNKDLVARMHERIRNRRKDRNHKLSRRLVAENELIVFSRDNHEAIAKQFGKSVTDSAHAQLRSMLSYKSRAGGRAYTEVTSRHSTRTCSACGARSGPAGYAGLKVRAWTCVACGANHDRDINAAINTLRTGLGSSHKESHRGAA